MEFTPGSVDVGGVGSKYVTTDAAGSRVHGSMITLAYVIFKYRHLVWDSSSVLPFP